MGVRLIIGNKNYSSWSLRPWLAMRQVGIEFEEHLIRLDTETAREEKLAHGPTARVPVLHHGDVTVWDSLAIVEYLAETWPERGLWPNDARARARARSLCAEMHSGFLDLRTYMPMNCRARKPSIDRGPAVAADIERITQCWRETRAEFGAEGPFLFGSFCLADAFFAPVATRFVTYAVDLDAATAAYRDTLLDLPPMRDWLAAAESEPMTLPETDAYS